MCSHFRIKFQSLELLLPILLCYGLHQWLILKTHLQEFNVSLYGKLRSCSLGMNADVTLVLRVLDLTEVLLQVHRRLHEVSVINAVLRTILIS